MRRPFIADAVEFAIDDDIGDELDRCLDAPRPILALVCGSTLNLSLAVASNYLRVVVKNRISKGAAGRIVERQWDGKESLFPANLQRDLARHIVCFDGDIHCSDDLEKAKAYIAAGAMVIASIHDVDAPRSRERLLKFAGGEFNYQTRFLVFNNKITVARLFGQEMLLR